MLSYDHGLIIIECDTCNEVLETETSKIYEAREVFEDAGWKSRNVHGAWFDICPICLEAEQPSDLPKVRKLT